MATFHPFPRLIPELRAEIWALAIENRVIRVKLGEGFYSPSPVPAVTRVCRESRVYCAYQQGFNVGLSGRYIWVNFDYDIIHVQALNLFVLPRESIKSLRVELVDEKGKEINEQWMSDYKHEFSNFLKLETIDLLVPDELRFYAEDIDETYFGNCKKENVRVVSITTGEWIDEGTSAVYWDYIDSFGGTYLESMTRVAEETLEERLEDIKKLKMPRPRIALDYL